jgi:hypothetical protein
MGAVIAEHMKGKNSVVVDSGHLILSDRLSAWEFRPTSSPKSAKSASATTPEETPTVAVYNGPPRVLEIGCGDGIWCFQVKKQYPDRIIEGVDDTDHWSCVHTDVQMRYVFIGIVFHKNADFKAEILWSPTIPSQ